MELSENIMFNAANKYLDQAMEEEERESIINMLIENLKIEYFIIIITLHYF